jgi:adenylate cyclase
MQRRDPIRSLPILLALIVGLFAATWLLFKYQSLWLPIFGAVAVVCLVYVALLGHYYLTERRERLEIRRMFSLYLSPKLVSRLEANPKLVSLGGERKQVTLMFTDLAGFTKVSEKLPPERVQALLNRHFDEMVDIIHRHDGLIDKFIGDAVMAFWGAPIDDPKHALNALNAAIEMQRTMEKLRGDLVADGLPAVHMRIGLNSGDAVIGNMGAKEKIQYTAIGDTVNLAARLEGINKLYGTPIIVSEATAQLAGESVKLRKLDRVKVSGKELPVTIYTPYREGDDEETINAAFDAYSKGHFDEALDRWQKIALTKPDDKVAAVFVERIEGLRSDPPAAWDGAVALEKF